MKVIIDIGQMVDIGYICIACVNDFLTNIKIYKPKDDSVTSPPESNNSNWVEVMN